MAICLLVIFFTLDSKNYSANYNIVFEQKEWWKAFTTMFVHADLSHLGANAVLFSVLGILLNNYFGWLVFPVVSLVAGGIINLLVLSQYPHETYLVGISGVVYFMGAFWMTLHFFIERQNSNFRRLTHVVALSLIIFFPDLMNLKPNVSYLAHSVGFGLGLLAGIAYFVLKYPEIRRNEVWTIVSDFEDFDEPEYRETEPHGECMTGCS